jgi:ABC-type microcin C transport system permease subunit YejB
MLERVKNHFTKSYNLVFWVLFTPAMLWTLFGVEELYTKYFDELTTQDHIQFFLRFFFPISLATLVTALERRQRLRRQALVKGIEKYLKN